MLDLDALPLPELFEHLVADGSLRRLLAIARDEDLGDAGDVTTASIVEVGGSPQARDGAGGTPRRTAGRIVAREEGVVAGLATLPALVRAFECRVVVEPLVADGDPCDAGQTLARIRGSLLEVLAVERTLLNLLGRLSGVATLTRAYVRAVAGTKAAICETRKTTPGWRGLEKYAVRCGGGTLHRLGLYDALLFKDNHLVHVGEEELAVVLLAAINRAREQYDLRFVEVEVDTADQLERVLGLPAGLVDIVLLDNMTPEELRAAVARRDELAPDLRLEASGGVDLETVRVVAETGVDRISVGALTRAASTLDIALDIASDDADPDGASGLDDAVDAGPLPFTAEWVGDDEP